MNPSLGARARHPCLARSGTALPDYSPLHCARLRFLIVFVRNWSGMLRRMRPTCFARSGTALPDYSPLFCARLGFLIVFSRNRERDALAHDFNRSGRARGECDRLAAGTAAGRGQGWPHGGSTHPWPSRSGYSDPERHPGRGPGSRVDLNRYSFRWKFPLIKSDGIDLRWEQISLQFGRTAWQVVV